ncbi:MAG: NADH-quinone oxidoreductase subunit N [Myxococcota bacterium]
MMSLWLLLSPLFALVGGGLLVMLVDSFVKEKAEVATATFVVFVVGAGCAAGLWVSGATAEAPDFVSAYLATDSMALFFDSVICAGGAFTALLAGGYLREHGLERGEFYVVLIFTTFGAMVLARAVDLLSIFIGLETMSLGAYALVAFRRTSPRAAEGAVKYFLLGSFAAAILLFGSALLYGGTGTTSLAGIGAAIAGGEAELTLVILGMLLVLVGLGFKVSAVPFHQWTPDAYEGAVTPATTFMSVAVKSAAFAVLVRVLVISFSDELSASAATGWPPVVAGLAAVTMIYGNFAAIAQTSVKRMLAYSSIAHAGYILVGVAAAVRVEQVALSAVFYYLLAYTVSNALAFGALILMGSKGKEAVSYEDLAGVGRRHPFAALAFIIGVLTLMGFPPTAGFFAKYYVFSAAVEAGGGMVWLAVLGVLTSAVGAYYYLKVIVYMFMKEPQPGAPHAVPMKSGYVAFALVIACLSVFWMGIVPSRYVEMAVQAASQLRDQDLDGVTDEADSCANTPRGVEVGPDGCETSEETAQQAPPAEATAAPSEAAGPAPRGV